MKRNGLKRATCHLISRCRLISIKNTFLTAKVGEVKLNAENQTTGDDEIIGTRGVSI